MFVVAGFPAVALAGGKPLPASQHSPPLVLSFPSLAISVSSQNDAGYTASAELFIFGATSKTDRLRFDWKSGGKVIGTAKCTVRYEEKVKTIQSTCKLEKEVKAKGPIEIDVIYTDDQQDKDYLVATLKTDVKNWKVDKNSQYWGLIPDDLLAASFVHFGDGGPRLDKPLFWFWSTNENLGSHEVMRCTVDGAKLPDFDVDLGNPADYGLQLVESGLSNEKEKRKYTFVHYQLAPEFRFGPKEVKGSNDGRRWLIDNPGKWDCLLRLQGKAAREFLFTVNAKGMIEPSEMQKGKNPIAHEPDFVMIDMKIPKDNGVEKRIRPDAIKKSIGFGVPWPDSPRSKELQGAFPAAMGLPDP
jgi:hypothetical protein